MRLGLLVAPFFLALAACVASSTPSDDESSPNPSSESEQEANRGTKAGTADTDDDTSPASPPAGDAPPAGLVWPNETSSANSDPWLVAHHQEITEIRPRALIINFANGSTVADVMTRWNAMSDAMSAMSRFHGYKDAAAKPFVKHELVKLVDLADRPVPSGWTAPNSTKMPRKNGGIDFAQLYSQTFANRYDIKDPNQPTHAMTICEMLAKGVINELFIAFSKSGGDGNVPEIIEYKQKYDDRDRPLAGQFEPQAGNGAFDPPDLPEARACGRSLRVDFLEMNGTLSGALHVLGHNFEHLAGAVPVHKKFFWPIYNYDFDKRFQTSFKDWYGISVNKASTDFIKFTGENTVEWTCPTGTSCVGQHGTFSPFNQGCGNTHYAPNSRNSYDMANPQVVLTRCEHYGLRDGPDGQDIQPRYSAATVAELAQKYGSDGNGGGWQVYLYQNFPSYQSKAKAADGTPIKNFWPYLFY
jgi:hypothetical protein